MFARVLQDPPPTDAPLEGNAVPEDAGCKRCKPYQFESKLHAFWLCPAVKEAWDQLLTWSCLLFPTLATHLRKFTPEQIQLCWPNLHKKLPPLLIHLHSLTSNAIWRNYCLIADVTRNKADLSEETRLIDLVKVTLRFRARVEVQRTEYQDTLYCSLFTFAVIGPLLKLCIA